MEMIPIVADVPTSQKKQSPVTVSPAVKTAQELTKLAEKLSAVISEYTKAAVVRNQIETEIAALIPSEGVGQKTVSLEDGTKITVKRGLIYKADLNKIEFALADFEALAPIKTKTTRELDIKGYEWYRANDSLIFPHIAQHVAVTPRKVSVTLKAAKEKV